MAHIVHNPIEIPAPAGGYVHALEVFPNARYLFVSGQIPTAEGSSAPSTFEAQALAVWQHIIHILRSGGMSLTDIVKVTTFLTHRDQADANGRIRREVLGTHTPALTVVVVELLDTQWMLEIEVIAAKAVVGQGRPTGRPGGARG